MRHLLQAKDAALRVGDSLQGRKDAFSGGTFSQSFPSEEGTYSISRALPAAAPLFETGTSSSKPSDEITSSTRPLKSAGQPETSPKAAGAENLLEEALRLRGGNGSQRTPAPASGSKISPTERKPAQNGSAAPENENLLEQAMAFRGKGSGLSDPEDPKDKKKPSPAAKKPEKEVTSQGSKDAPEDLLAEALRFRESGKADNAKPKSPPKPVDKQTPAVAKEEPQQEDLLAEAMRFRQSGSGNGSKPSTAAKKPQPSPASPPKAAASSGPSQGSQPDSGNLLEEALRLRGEGTAKPSPPLPSPATAAAPAATPKDSETAFKGSDDLIFQAQEAASTATPGQQPLKASAEGSSSEKNVDLLGKNWQDATSGKGIQQSSAASLPRSDSLIMQSQQNNGGMPQGMPKLSVGDTGGSGQGQINPAAGKGPTLGGRATEEPLKGALQRQQEQSKLRAVDQEESPPPPEEEPEEEEGLLAEALRLRGSQPSRTQIKPPPKPAASKIERAPAKSEEGEDLLAAALRYRSEPSSSASKGKQPLQKAEEANEKLPQGEDLLAEAMRFRNEQPAKKASSTAPQQPLAKVDKAEEQDSEGEDLLAEALRLRGQSPTSSAPQKTAPQPAAAKKASTEVDDSKNTDLLAEALRLRAEGLASSSKVHNPFSSLPLTLTASYSELLFLRLGKAETTCVCMESCC